MLGESAGNLDHHRRMASSSSRGFALGHLAPKVGWAARRRSTALRLQPASRARASRSLRPARRTGSRRPRRMERSPTAARTVAPPPAPVEASARPAPTAPPAARATSRRRPAASSLRPMRTEGVACLPRAIRARGRCSGFSRSRAAAAAVKGHRTGCRTSSRCLLHFACRERNDIFSKMPRTMPGGGTRWARCPTWDILAHARPRMLHDSVDRNLLPPRRA